MNSETSRSERPTLPRPEAPPDWRERLALGHERAVDLIADRPGVRLLVGILAVALVGGLGLVLLRPQGSQPPLETMLPTLDPVVAATAAPEPAGPATVVVHVAGAVVAPGLVELPAGSRVADAVAAAGGAAADADLDRVNLALVLTDADRVAVPRVGEEPPPLVEPMDGGAGDGDSGGGPVDLNTADQTALETLPGVGPATAMAIIAHRDEHGPFVSVAALDEVPGIGPAKLAQLRDLVTAGP